MADYVRIEGLDEVLKAIEDLGRKEAYKRAMENACLLVERTAKQKAPKDSGELRRSITSKVEEIDGDIVGVVYTPLEYAPYIEFGTGLFAENGGRMDVPWCYKDDEGEWHTTSGIHPHPYLNPALKENRKKIKRMIEEAIGQ